MNLQEALEYFEKIDDQYLKAKEKNPLRVGLQILETYTETIKLYAYHELICVGHIDNESNYSQYDLLALRKLGFHIKDDMECFGFFT